MLNSMIKMRNKKGFTLMEMLIVVAIIAILIAIAIPTFNKSLNNAKVATDEANIRSGYAAVQTDIMLNNVNADKTYYLHADGSVGDSGTNYTTQGSTDAGTTIAGVSVPAWGVGASITYVYSNSAGTITITPVAAAKG